MRIAALVLVVMAGCGLDKLDDLGRPQPNDPAEWPAVESLYSVTTEAVTCSGTYRIVRTPEQSPTQIICQWQRVTVAGAPMCFVSISFARTPDYGWNESGSVTIAGDECP